MCVFERRGARRGKGRGGVVKWMNSNCGVCVKQSTIMRHEACMSCLYSGHIHEYVLYLLYLVCLVSDMTCFSSNHRNMGYEYVVGTQVLACWSKHQGRLN